MSAVAKLTNTMNASYPRRPAMPPSDATMTAIAAPFALFVGASWGDRALAWPALSAGAIVLDHVVLRLRLPEVAVYQEDPEEA